MSHLETLKTSNLKDLSKVDAQLKGLRGSKPVQIRAIQVSQVYSLIALVPLRHFRKPFHIPFELSTVGLGTYIGAPDDQTDFDVYNAVKLMVMSGGVNVIDTAINYRCQKAERTLGAALKTLNRKYGVQRDELFISTKNGYIPVNKFDLPVIG